MLRRTRRLVSPSQVPEVPVYQSAANLGLGNVDEVLYHVSTMQLLRVISSTYTLHSVVKVARVHDLTIQKTTLSVPNLSAPLLVDQQPAPESLWVNLKEARKLGQVHGSVELQVASNHWAVHVVLDLLHEDGEVVLNRVDVEVRVVEVWWGWGDEPWAGGAEELLEDWKSLWTTPLHLGELLAVLLPQGGVDGVVEAGWVESNADGDKSVHLVSLLGDGVVLGVLLEVLGAGDVDEDVGEHADSVGVAVHHHVGETDVVVGREVGSHDACEHGLLVELDVVEGLDGEGEVTKETVDAEESDDREVAEHLVERAVAVLAGVESTILAALAGCELLADLGTLDERVEDVQDAVATPGVWVLAQNHDLLLVVSLERNALAVAAEAVELVDELVNDLPCPEVLSQVSENP